MKLKKLIFAGCVAFSGVQISNAQTIVGTKHDFSSASWNNTSPVPTDLQGQICTPCHTPHNSVDTVLGSIRPPLWNHKLTSAVFTLYSGYQFDGALTITQPDGSSKLCLSCHDGTVALNSFRSFTGSVFMTGASMQGTDLRNDHPISFIYDAALAITDRGLYDPTMQISGLPGGGTIDHDMLEAHKLQCRSCHDPHNGGPSGVSHLLIKSNAGSELCLTCHKK
jgi:predicted CXXCH cytochrome family protein